MPKDKITIKETNGFALTDFIKSKGYKAKIDGKLVVVHRNAFNGSELIRAAYCEVQTGFDEHEGTPVMQKCEQELPADISDKMLFELVTANVVALTEEQDAKFHAKHFKAAEVKA